MSCAPKLTEPLHLFMSSTMGVGGRTASPLFSRDETRPLTILLNSIIIKKARSFICLLTETSFSLYL